MGGGSSRPRKSAAQRGISNDQARELARLCKRLKIPYDGRGLTSPQASQLIADRRAKITAKASVQPPSRESLTFWRDLQRQLGLHDAEPQEQAPCSLAIGLMLADRDKLRRRQGRT